MGAEVAAPSAASRADASIQIKSNDVDSTSNSSMLVLLSVVVIAVSLALLPMSAVTVIMAAMAGLWWLSSGNGTTTVQMNSLIEAGSASNGHAAGVGATAADAAAGLEVSHYDGSVSLRFIFSRYDLKMLSVRGLA